MTMHNNVDIYEYDWCDDERSVVHNLRYSNERVVPTDDYGFGTIFKEILRQDRDRPKSMQWDEISYREYEFEPIYPNIGDIDDDRSDDSDAHDVVETNGKMQDHDDLTYQGLVKNKFMYT